MKEISKILLLFIFSYILSGCYTVAWQPGKDLPTKDNLKQDQSNFYNVKNFGVFSEYYYSAWWLNPDNDFLLNNLTAVLDSDDDIVNFIIDVIYLPPLPPEPIIDVALPTIIPILVTPNPTKRRNIKPLKKSPPTRDKNSNKNKLRNNNGGRKTTKGRNR